MSTPGINPYSTPYVNPLTPVRQVVEMTPDDLKEVNYLVQKRLAIQQQKKILEDKRDEIRQHIAKEKAEKLDCIISGLSSVFLVKKQDVLDLVPEDKLFSIQIDLEKGCLKIDEKEMNEVILPFASAKRSQKVNFAHFKDEITEKAMLAFLRALPTNSVQLLGMKRPLTAAETALKDAIVPTLLPRKLVVKQM